MGNWQHYRSISLLSNTSKIFEKVVHARLCNYLYTYATSYMTCSLDLGNSTQLPNALVHMFTSINEALDGGEYACGLLLALQKSFSQKNFNKCLTKAGA